MNPEIASLLNNPAFVEQLMNSPEIHNILDSNPQLRDAFQNM